MKILVVGAGFYGSIMAHLYSNTGNEVTVIDKRSHIGGNSYTRNQKGIHIHEYGPHIFHTNDQKIWTWINRFCQFNNFTLRPFTVSGGKLYSLPFNMLTFNQLWGVNTPEEAFDIIEKQRYRGKVTNLEEQALSLVGKDVYEKLIKGYTMKQWKKDPKLLPSSIIRRLPVRFTYENNYFNDKYQGIPIGGYTQVFEELLKSSEVYLEKDFFTMDTGSYDRIIYTGPIDKYFNFKYGRLEYRSLTWKHKEHQIPNVQGISMLNQADLNIDYTRTIEHRHFDESEAPNDYSITTQEFPSDYIEGLNEPLYPINDINNSELYKKYKALTKKETGVMFGGRLATYKYTICIK